MLCVSCEVRTGFLYPRRRHSSMQLLLHLQFLSYLLLLLLWPLSAKAVLRISARRRPNVTCLHLSIEASLCETIRGTSACIRSTSHAMWTLDTAPRAWLYALLNCHLHAVTNYARCMMSRLPSAGRMHSRLTARVRTARSHRNSLQSVS
jgi:hypothetical protein